ncbi:MAG: tryptophan 2,3-dioxygenase, partial [Bacteroidetes bacterium SW_10_40_5]
FEAQYEDFLIYFATRWQGMTLWDKYYNLPEEIHDDPEVIKHMRHIDKFINIYWPKAHYGTAKHYLESDYADEQGTGGTNYQEYLPPELQQRMFFPELWSESEKNQWGKTHNEG